MWEDAGCGTHTGSAVYRARLDEQKEYAHDGRLLLPRAEGKHFCPVCPMYRAR
jgi:hypothetical protein